MREDAVERAAEAVTLRGGSRRVAEDSVAEEVVAERLASHAVVDADVAGLPTGDDE